MALASHPFGPGFRRISFQAISRTLLGMAIASASACAASTPTSSNGQGGAGPVSAGESGPASCIPGATIPCECPAGEGGVQRCAPDGTEWTMCSCEPLIAEKAKEGCGDGLCTDGETCHSCSYDCGRCDPCNLAPSCNNAYAPPAISYPMPELDLSAANGAEAMVAQSAASKLARVRELVRTGAPGFSDLAAALQPEQGSDSVGVRAVRSALAKHPTIRSLVAERLQTAMAEAKVPRIPLSEPSNEHPATIECGAPKLRIQLERVLVRWPQDIVGGDVIYCVMTGDSAAGGEVRMTDPTGNMFQNDDWHFAPNQGSFWGQDGPRSPGGDLVLSFNCFEQDNQADWIALTKELGDVSKSLGAASTMADPTGQTGFALVATGAVGDIISALLALNTDDEMFQLNQVINIDQQLALTNGRYWSISLRHPNDAWDWEFRINAWGCAEHGELETKY